MANVIRHTAVWSGTPGLPGYTQFYQEAIGDVATKAQIGHDLVRLFFSLLSTLIPEDISVTVDPVYQIVDIPTGNIVGEATVTTPSAVVAGGFVSAWQRQVGVLVEWLTPSFIAGRRLRGRTYLVPLGNTSDDDGTLPSGTLSTVATAAGAIDASSGDFVVWHRPVAGAGGQVSSITSSVIRDHAAVLRSRMI